MTRQSSAFLTPSLQVILFELDATLADSRSVYPRAFAQVFRQVLQIELTPVLRLTALPPAQ